MNIKLCSETIKYRKRTSDGYLERCPQ